MTTWTRESIVDLLKSNDKAICRALVVLNERQTFDEQLLENTKYQNGEGFTAVHARIGTSMAKFYLKNGFLTKKQIAYWREKTTSGRMRIEIYASQLLTVVKNK